MADEDYYSYGGNYDLSGIDLSGIGGFDLNSLLNDTSWLDSYTNPLDFTNLPVQNIGDYTYTGMGQTGYSPYSNLLGNTSYWNTNPSAPASTSSLLGNLGGTVGSLGKGVLDFLSSSTGKSLLGLGGAAASISGGSPKTTTDISRTPTASQAGQELYKMAQQQPLGMSSNAMGLYNNMNLASLLNVFPEQTWQNAENMIPQTQAAREAALSSKLGRVAPNAYSSGNRVQDMIAQISKENDYMTQLATQLQQAKAGAQQTANLALPTQFSQALGLANYPQTYTMGNIGNLTNILQGVERGTMGTQSTGIDQSILSQLGGVLAALAGTK